MKIKKISMIEKMVAFHFTILMLSYCLSGLGNYLNYIAYATGVILFILLYSKNWHIKIELKERKILKILISISILYYICLIVSGRGSTVIPLKIVFQYAPVSIFLVNKGKLNRNIWIAVSLIITVLVEFFWFRSPDRYILFPGMSRNYISLFLIVALFLITIIYERERKNIPIIIPILYLGLCIYGIGRVGMISGILYLLFVLLYRTFKDSQKKYKGIKIILLFISAFALMVLAVIYEQKITKLLNARFISGVYVASNNGRMRIYMAYLGEISSSLKNFIFGINPISVAKTLNFEIGDNLHSSYLQLHSAFGIFGFVAFFAFMIKAIRFFIEQRWYQMVCLAMIYLIRIASDYAICGFITDIIGLYFIFCPILYREDVTSEKNARNRLF